MSEKERNEKQQVQPNKFYRPYLNSVLDANQEWYSQYGSPQYDPATLESHALRQSLAESSVLPYLGADEVGQTLRGAYLDVSADPRFSGAFARVGDHVARYGDPSSGGYRAAMADAQQGAMARLYGDERARMNRAAGMAPGAEAGRYAPLEQLRQVGAEREQQAWGGLSADALNYYLTVLNASPYATYQETNTPVFHNPQLEHLGGAMGVASAAGGIAAAFSDARLKKNVRPLGSGVYEWDWNDEARAVGADRQPSRGVIAQEVALYRPEAVWVGPGGYLMVDYSILGDPR